MRPHDTTQHQATLKACLSQIEKRIDFLRLTPQSREILSHFSATLPQQHTQAFLDQLYERFQQTPQLSALLGSQEQIKRLKKLQETYFQELLTAPLDAAYFENRIHIGITHHRVHLTPQWYIASYAHFLVEHVDAIWLFSSKEPKEFCKTLSTFFKSILFDASLALDAYGMSVEMDIKNPSTLSSSPSGGSPQETEKSNDVRQSSTRHSITRLRLSPSDLQQRMGYLDIDQHTQQELSHNQARLQQYIPTVLENFYDFLEEHPELKEISSPETFERLKQIVPFYWQELFQATFDRTYTASRSRIGLVHERIGLSLQWYFAGLAHQVETLLCCFAEDPYCSPSLVKSLFRAIFFDLTFIIDAYMEARAENLLRAEGYAAQLIAGLHAGVLVVDEHLRVLSANQMMLQLLHIDAALLQFMPLQDALPIKKLPQVLLSAWEQNLPRASFYETFQHRHFRVSVIPLQSPSHNALEKRAAILLDEISAILQASEELQSAEQGFEHLVQSIHGVVWEADPSTWTIEMISKPILEQTGFRDIFFLGRSDVWLQQIPEPDRARVKEACKNLAIGQETHIEHRFIRKDKTEIWLQSHIRAFQKSHDHRTLLAGLTVDITESVHIRQKLDERLADKEIVAHFSRSVAQSPRNKHLLQSLVEACTQLQGISYACAITQDLQAHMHLTAQAGTLSPHLSQQLSACYKTLFLHSPFFVNLSHPPSWFSSLGIQIAAHTEMIAAPILWNEEREAVLLAFSNEGHTWTPERADVIETLAHIVELAYQRYIQEGEQRHQQRLELLGLLASGIAHDLNNLLSSVSISTNLLQEKIPSDSSTKELFQLIEEVVLRGQELAQDVLHFSKPQHETQTDSPVDTALETTERFVRALLPDKIALSIKTHTQASVPLAPRHIQQILLNLALNASQAIQGQGTIHISAKEKQFDQPTQLHSGLLPPGTYVAFSVEDNGSGIEPHIIHRLFDPFFTTKSDKLGSGMGLSVILRLVKEAHGAIDLSTQPNQGTCFTVYLPRVLPSVVPPPQTTLRQPQTTTHLDHTKYVLLVDDEPTLQQAITVLLQKHGLKVKIASSGAQALEILQKNHKDIQAILSDLHMPHLSGLELALRVRQDFGPIPILLFSGLPIEMPHNFAEQNIAFLQKPFRIQKLLETLEHILSPSTEPPTPKPL